jgi:hypothetical protein
MRTWRRCVAAGALAVVLVGSTGVLADAWAQSRGGGGARSGAGSRGSGGWHGGGGSYTGSHSGRWHGAGRQHWHGWKGGVVVGFPSWYPYGYGYPYYGYAYPYWDPYPAHAWPGPVEPEPQAYLQRDPQTEQSWYYCQGPAEGYYPHVNECPTGWIPVAPRPSDMPAPR